MSEKWVQNLTGTTGSPHYGSLVCHEDSEMAKKRCASTWCGGGPSALATEAAHVIMGEETSERQGTSKKPAKGSTDGAVRRIVYICSSCNASSYDGYGEFRVRLNANMPVIPDCDCGYTVDPVDDLEKHMHFASLKGGARSDCTNKKWYELSDEERWAARKLGVGHGITWDAESELHVVWQTEWGELDKEQQQAAGYLGYSESIWSASGKDIDNKSFAQLSRDEKEAAGVLGFTTAAAWKTNDSEVWHMQWRDLDAPQKIAAKLLGYNEEKWNSA